jgi:hypothetical protein
MSPAKKRNKLDHSAAIGFTVNFCAMFSLIFTIGLLAAAGIAGGNSSGAASLSQGVKQTVCSCPPAEECPVASLAPAVLFPVSAQQPTETASEISVDEGGFSSQEINLSNSSSRTLKIVNNGVRPHSFAITEIGLNSGIIEPGRFVTVALDGPPAGRGKVEFYSAESGDSGENFRGTIIFE